MINACAHDAETLRPEARLLLACARAELGPGDAGRIRTIVAGGIDWPHLDRLATRHGLLPLLQRHLQAVAANAVPKPVFASFWARCEATRRRNQAMAAELAAIASLFEARGAASIPYKGPTLALAAYGDLGAREFGDLDLLVRCDHVRLAKEVLVARGYVPQLALTAELEAALLRAHRSYEMPFVHPGRRIMVELHWRTDPDFAVSPLDDEHWWRGLPTQPFEHTVVRALPPRELMLILCLHGTKHFWHSLGWLVDVAELARRHPGLDWQWIAARSRDLGCARRLALGLRLARDLLDFRAPEEMAAIVRDAAIDAPLATIRRTLFAAGHEPPPVLAALRLNARLHDRRGPALCYMARALLTPGLGEWQRWPLPRSLFFLYFPLRVARLAAKYLPLPRFGAGKAELPPRLEDHDGHGIGQVEAAVAGPHRET